MGEAMAGSFTVHAGDGVSDPVPYDASPQIILAAFEQAKSRSTVRNKSKFPGLSQ